MSKKKSRKERIGIVYSTSDDFEYDYNAQEEQESLPPQQQQLRVLLDTKKRKGKTVTLVTGYVGTDEDFKDLGKLLKQKCGVGGTAKDGEILVQGDFKQKIIEILQKEGYKAK